VILRVEPLRHDALTAELACLAKYNRAVLLEMLIEDDAQIRSIEKFGQQVFALSIG
jgi:hypothetical protein